MLTYVRAYRNFTLINEDRTDPEVPEDSFDFLSLMYLKNKKGEPFIIIYFFRVPLSVFTRFTSTLLLEVHLILFYNILECHLGYSTSTDLFRRGFSCIILCFFPLKSERVSRKERVSILFYEDDSYFVKDLFTV